MLAIKGAVDFNFAVDVTTLNHHNKLENKYLHKALGLHYLMIL